MANKPSPATEKFLDVFADVLEAEHGKCLSGRAALLEWIYGQIQRLAKLDVPDNLTAGMIDTAYMQWQAEVLGLDINE